MSCEHKNENDHAKGTIKEPFRTISKAADSAMPEDTVIVHEGVYREWADLKEGGMSNLERIVYQAENGCITARSSACRRKHVSG
ncbi:MAG: DUF1565 domain-containing protein [Lachnospiraceae bacterium]|nr:DUF1565 domain-containing protein [Lachnospiraceae bacterium]